jgi:diadenosine tetraphosphate (Ap4A) HIT family hydrolase
LTKLDQLPADEPVWQFPSSVAFLGPWQYYTGYCVLVARSHADEMHRLPAVERCAFLEEMVTLARAIETTFHPRKMNCESLGNQVPHPHWHLFPRSDDDPETMKAVWLALDRAERDESEKRRLQSALLPRAEIRSRLQQTLTQMGAPSA